MPTFQPSLKKLKDFEEVTVARGRLLPVRRSGKRTGAALAEWTRSRVDNSIGDNKPEVRSVRTDRCLIKGGEKEEVRTCHLIYSTA